MSYMHIGNLYKDQRILLFKRCYALEKVHGTSAHVIWNASKVTSPGVGGLTFFSGGESYEKFRALFDETVLREVFEKFGYPDVTVYGEAYGGKCQGMKDTYGDKLRFIAFEVQVGENFLSVPDAEQVAVGLGFEFVPYREISTDLAELDAERDRPSEVAVRRGCGGDKEREGIVLRPLIELRANNDERIIAKHKGEKFEERKTPQKVVSPETLAVLSDAKAISEEWVTPMRLQHVLDKLPQGIGIEKTGDVVRAMVEDVLREAAGEIVVSKEAKSAIGRRAAELFKERVKSGLK